MSVRENIALRPKSVCCTLLISEPCKHISDLMYGHSTVIYTTAVSVNGPIQNLTSPSANRVTLVQSSTFEDLINDSLHFKNNAAYQGVRLVLELQQRGRNSTFTFSFYSIHQIWFVYSLNDIN